MNNSFYIIGVKHCGKSSVGKDLAHNLKIPFFDLDEMIEDSVKMSVRDFFLREGKDSFQKEETKALLQLEKQGTNFICATGGGICDNNDAYELLKTRNNIFIDVNFETVYNRIVKNGKPAFLKSDNPKEEFKTIYLKRVNLYSNLADFKIDGNNKTQSQISTQLITKIRE